MATSNVPWQAKISSRVYKKYNFKSPYPCYCWNLAPPGQWTSMEMTFENVIVANSWPVNAHSKSLPCAFGSIEVKFKQSKKCEWFLYVLAHREFKLSILKKFHENILKWWRVIAEYTEFVHWQISQIVMHLDWSFLLVTYHLISLSKCMKLYEDIPKH